MAVRWLLLAICASFAVSGCAYKGGLKTPTEAEEAARKKEKKKEKAAERAQQQAPEQSE